MVSKCTSRTVDSCEEGWFISSHRKGVVVGVQVQGGGWRQNEHTGRSLLTVA